MITVSYDDSDGVIRTVTYGQTSRDEIEDYLNRLMDVTDRAREKWGRVLHLVDASHLAFHSDENLKSLAGSSIDVHHEDGDRIAVIMTSARAIKQMEQMPSQLGTMIFGDFASAKSWLFADFDPAEALAA